MSRYHSYLNSATAILLSYKGEEPFASFIKKYFAAHKKFGSTDRKTVSHLCYCYFRMGKALAASTGEEKILTGLFLCSREPNNILEQLKSEWNQLTTLSLNEKIIFLDQPGLANSIFLWTNELSDSIDKEKFAISHLQQPDLFLRLRPGKEERVKQQLSAATIHFDTISDNCLAVANSSKVDSVIELDKEAVVQDLNSQRTGEFLELVIRRPSDPVRVWDCCAASGGKSILAIDLLGEIDLTVSDIRESILVNLKGRFAKAGIKKYKSFIADLSKEDGPDTANNFDLVIADLPCSGSGTWSRTPEQLVWFDEKKISGYAALQQKIIANIIPSLAPGGHLLYITCSVFKKENEEAVAFLKEKFHLQVVKMEFFKGYDKKADTLFAALLQKPL